MRLTYLVALIAFAPPAIAVELAPLFTDHAVLQQGRPVPIWGTGDSGEHVFVYAAGQQAETVTDGNGRWTVWLTPLIADGRPFDLTVVGTNAHTRHDLLAGEVWLCSGQSNMEFPVTGALDAEREIAAASFPHVRLFTVARQTATEPLATCDGIWQPCTPESVRAFSAVAYFFGREVHHRLQVPIGLINVSWSGTPAEAWTDSRVLAADPVAREVFPAWERRMATLPQAQARFAEQLTAWEKSEKSERLRPRAPEGHDSPHRPGVLRNGMIAPLVPYALRGVLWYQGEANAARPAQYRSLLPLMISDWRMAFGQDDLPFYFVQLANLAGRNWPEMRETQRQIALAVPNTGLAVTIDIGERDDVHPRNKQAVGQRLALLALRRTYGLILVDSGPHPLRVERDGRRAVITFTHAGSGLTTTDATLRGFEVAGADGTFQPAEAVISGSQVVVWHPQVPEPMQVRYAWADDPQTTLANRDGLPAVPFRCAVQLSATK